MDGVARGALHCSFLVLNSILIVRTSAQGAGEHRTVGEQGVNTKQMEPIHDLHGN